MSVNSTLANVNSTLAGLTVNLASASYAITLNAHDSASDNAAQQTIAIQVSGGGGGTQYYFSSSAGNDAGNNCTSSSTPCATIVKLNSISYPNGSTINLKAGDTWNAGTTITLCASVGPPVSGVTTPCDSSAAINVNGTLTITAYGGGTCNPIAGVTSGCATLQASGSQTVGVYAGGLSNLTIQNLRVLGNTSATLATAGCGDTGNQRFTSIIQCITGIYYTNNNTMTSNITITNNEVNGYDQEIIVNSAYPFVLSSNVTVSNNYAHGNSVSSADQEGILVGGVQNSLIQGNMVANLGGTNQVIGITGPSGIVMGATLNTTNQFNVTHDNGANQSQGAGNWQYLSSGITLQFNESYNQLAGGNYDGEGFDFDCGMNGSIGQFNYSHNNWGPGFYFYSAGAAGTSGWCNEGTAPTTYPWGGAIYWGNNQFRYNISAGDMYGWAGGSRAAFSLEVGTQSGTNGWYNNTIYTHAATNSTTNGQCFGNTANNMSSMLVYNNVCYNDTGNPFINTGFPVANFDYNDYYRTGSTPTNQWSQNGNNYANFSAWKGSGNDAHGLNVNPNFNGTVAETICYSTSVPTGYFSCPTWDKLSSGSPLVGAGADLSSIFTLPTHDYFGHSIPNGVNSGYNIGADGGNP